MRTRLLTPFVSAVAGSMLLLLAMFAWSAYRNTGSPVLFGTPAAYAEQDEDMVENITATLEITDTEITLGDSMPFSLSVVLTPSLGFTVTWDFDNGVVVTETIYPTADMTTTLVGVPPGVPDNLIVGPFDLTVPGSRPDGPGFPFYTETGAYTVVAQVEPFTATSATGVFTPITYLDMETSMTMPVVLSSSIQVTVVEAPPVEDNTMLMLDVSKDMGVEIGEEVTYTAVISNYNADIVDAVRFYFSNTDPMTVTTDDFDVMIDTASMMQTIAYTEPGTFYITSTVVYADDFTPEMTPTAGVSVSVVMPSADFTVDPNRLEPGETVYFTATVESVDESVVDRVLFDVTQAPESPSDITPFQVETSDGELSGSSEVTDIGRYEVNATVYLEGGYWFMADNPRTFIVTETVTDPVLDVVALTAADSSILADNDNPGSTVLTAIVSDTDNLPMANQMVTMTISSPTWGARFGDDSTQVMGTTDLNGVFTATLQAASLNGNVSVMATTADPSITATVGVTLQRPVGAEVLQQEVSFSSEEDNTIAIDLQPLSTDPITVFVPASEEISGTFNMVISGRSASDTTEVVSKTTDGKDVLLPFEVQLFVADGENDGADVSSEVTAETGARVSIPLGLVTGFAALQQTGIDTSSLALYDAPMTSTLPIQYSPIEGKTSEVSGGYLTSGINQLGDHAVVGSTTTTTPTNTVYLPLIVR